MYIPGLVSVVIPARNEPYLKKTILDLLEKAAGEIEIIVNLDGYWPAPEDIVDNPKVIYIHRSKALGMRAGINSGVAIAKGEYILKSDAHCLYAQGFDSVLKQDIKDNWVVVPRRYPLDPEKWQIEERSDNKYPIDRMYLSTDLHGVAWPEGNTDALIEDTPSSQGSCWFMKKDYFHELELLDDEKWGSFYLEFQEIGLKTWLSGGEIKVNKNTWYAHFHKTIGRGYSLDKGEQEKAEEAIAEWTVGKGWHKQKLPLAWFKEKWPNMPGWEEVQ
jgi:glycosyltransferase involved in cell wall biosynthesis